MKKIILSIIISVLIFLQACNKLIEVDKPFNQLTPEGAYKDESSILAVLNGIYGQLSSESVNEILSVRHALYADDIATTSTATSYREFMNSTLKKENFSVGYIWQVFYSLIYKCNDFSANVRSSNTISETRKNELIAEATTIRSFCYFHLINTFGAVPLILTSSVAGNTSVERSNVNEIYTQLTADLKNAAAILPESYGNADKVRFNKFGALALLARLSLYTGDPQTASDAATEIISSQQFDLPADLEVVFKANSNEVIFQLWTTYGYAGIANLFIPYPGDDPLFPISQSLLNSFEPGDLRKEKWISQAAGTDYYYPSKYTINGFTAGNGTEYTMVLRLAEQYLIRADARLQSPDVAGALSDINVIRTRAGLSPVTGTITADSCAKLLEAERRKELFTEWGDRFYNLKRTSRLDEVMSAEKATWKSNAAIYPIPFSEILNNSTLTQNPGY